MSAKSINHNARAQRARDHIDRVADRVATTNAKLYDDYLAQAHEMIKGMVSIPCGTFGRGHHPLEEKIARACVAAFHRGKASGRR